MSVEALKTLRSELLTICESAAVARGGCYSGTRETVKRLERRIDELLADQTTEREYEPEAGTAQRVMKRTLERIVEADTPTNGKAGPFAEEALTALSLAKQRVPVGYGEWHKHVHAAYRCLREFNSTIPDEVIETMKVVLLSHDGPFTGLRKPAPSGGTNSIDAEKLYQCNGCGAHYQTKVTSCDCSEENAPFAYTRAYAVSHEAIEQLLWAARSSVV